MSDATLTRRAAVLALLSLAVGGCGGGGSGGTTDASMAGSLDTKSIDSHSNGTTYPLNLYYPPDSVADRPTLPVVVLLDGESRFRALVDSVELTHTRLIIVGIGNEALRGRDYVPANLCTPGGGGQVAFFDFIRLELIPFIDASIGADPKRRILLGHSHGGSFVLYALFAEAPGAHRFAAYLASDASVGCMQSTVDGWEQAYATAQTALPVRLHIAYSANLANAALAQQIAGRHYTGLALQSQFYAAGHIGMVPAAFTDAIRFALA